MSKILATLTTESEKDTGAVVDKLESLAGFSSEDVRFIAKHRQETVKKIADLGLDPQDTTAEELFHALQTKLNRDARSFAKTVNYREGEAQSNSRKLVELAMAALPSVDVFALKKTSAKNLLRAEPPQHLIKKLKYRSLESMLKREDICELFNVLPVTESQAWQNKFLARLSNLKASNFETRSLSYHAIGEAKWLELASPKQPVSYVPLMGAVTVWPVAALNRAESAAAALLVLQAAEILEIDSLYLKNYQFFPQFGKLAGKLYETGEQQQLQIADRPFFDWHNLKPLFSSQVKPLEAFTSLHPIFSWWKDAGKTVLVGGEELSSHMADVLSGLLYEVDFSARRVNSGAAAVKSLVLEKYLEHSNVENYFRAQLDDTSLALEPATDEDSIMSDMNTEPA